MEVIASKLKSLIRSVLFNSKKVFLILCKLYVEQKGVVRILSIFYDSHYWNGNEKIKNIIHHCDEYKYAQKLPRVGFIFLSHIYLKI